MLVINHRALEQATVIYDYLQIWQLKDFGDGIKVVFCTDDLVTGKLDFNNRHISIARNTEPSTNSALRAPIKITGPSVPIQVLVEFVQNVPL